MAALPDAPDVVPAVAAPAPLRRLTDEHYRQTVRDLFGVPTAGITLPIDEGTAGFFANTIAPVSELQLEQYARAAELVARAAAPALARNYATSGAAADRRERFIAGLGRRVYRRPLTADESRSLGELFRSEAARAGDEAAIRAVVATLLASPNFLYLVEPLEPVAPGAKVARLAPHALASRLAFFLWGRGPDDALLAAADSGALATRADLARETARLMADRRFKESLASFHLQWLDLTELAGVEKRTKLYPLFTHELRAAMREETVRFVDHVFARDRGDDAGKLATLLAGRFSIVGGGLYEVYGLGKKKDAEAGWRKVDFSSGRAGLFTQTAFLTRHAHWDKPSLVLRGKVVRERLFCTDLPPPPPDVNNTPPPFDPKVSMRERFEDHRDDVSCSRCHRLIDPLGIPFESFDGIGAVRTMDGPAPVDPTSEIEGTAKSNGPVKDAVDMMEKLAVSDEVRDCVALQWLRYATGRDATAADAASLAHLRAVFKQSGYRVPALIAAIPTTDAFRYAEVTR